MKDSKAHLFRPRKQLGQHFLVDKNIIEKILTHCQLKKDESVLEIGPGLGAITGEIAGRVHHVFAVEKDKRFCDELSRRFKYLKNITLIHGDFLKMDFSSLPGELKVIGNLPYYISSAIIAKALENRKQVESLFITVQWEFGKRLAAKINSKDYSALSVFVQYYMQPKMLFKIKHTAFRPTPKVDSCFVHLALKKTLEPAASDESLLWEIVHKAFQQRRKQIINSLGATIGKEEIKNILKRLGLNAELRAENLTPQDFVNLANCLGAQNSV